MASEPTPSEPFVLRVVALDYYLAQPIPDVDICWSDLEGVAVDKVPVVRIFGATPAGQKTCLHLHKAFPYFYIPYEADLPSEPSAAASYLRCFALALNVALSMQSGSTIGQNGPDQEEVPGARAFSRQRVFAVALVRGRPLYGYQPDEHLWIKLLFYDPRDVGRAASLVSAGAVLGHRFQPHESHVPYLLQVKTDLNIQGMEWLVLDKALFRMHGPQACLPTKRLGWAPRPLIQQIELGMETSPGVGMKTPPGIGVQLAIATAVHQKVWKKENIPVSMTNNLLRQSTCELEVDGFVEDVKNRHDVNKIQLASAGPNIRMVESLAPMWEDEQRRCGGVIPAAPPDVVRLPQPLGPAVELAREGFREVEVARRVTRSEDVNSDNDMANRMEDVPACRPLSQLLAGTQAANEAALASQLFTSIHDGAEGPPTAEEDYARFVDEAVVMTQMTLSLKDADDPSQDRAGEILRSNEENGGRLGEDSDDEDMLLALARQLTPMQEATLRRAQIVASQPETEGVLGRSYRGSSREASYRKAQDALEQFLEATQRECDDILECSLRDPENSVVNEIDQNNDAIKHPDATNESLVPQVDGAWEEDGVVPAGEYYPTPHTARTTSVDDADGETDDPGLGTTPAGGRQNITVPWVPGLRRPQIGNSAEEGSRGNQRAWSLYGPTERSGRAALVENAGQPQASAEEAFDVDISRKDGIPLTEQSEAWLTVPSSNAYVSREEVRAATASLAATFQLLHSDNGPVPSLLEPPALVSEPPLPPTQPLEEDTAVSSPLATPLNGKGDLDPTVEQAVPPTVAQDQRAPEQIIDGVYLKDLDAPMNDAWWRDEVSQIPFHELGWDMMDDFDPVDDVAKESTDGSANAYRNEVDSPSLAPSLARTEIAYDGILDAPRQDVVVSQPRRRPPSATDLMSSCWDVGILPVLHPAPHFSDPTHVPRRPVVFAGKEFKVPCTAVDRLPLFGEAFERLRSSCVVTPLPASANIFSYAPVKRPPSRAQINAWLQREGRCQRQGNASGSTPAMVMDPNTGKFVPSEGRSQDESFSKRHGDELLATPSLPSVPSQAKSIRKPMGPRAVNPMSMGNEEVSPADKAHSEIRPSSPKYDERTMFFNDPFAPDEPPSLRGRTGWHRLQVTHAQQDVSTTTPRHVMSTPLVGGQQMESTNKPKTTASLKSAVKAAKLPGMDSPSQGSKSKKVAFSGSRDDVVETAARDTATALAGEGLLPGPGQRKRRSQFISQITPFSPSDGAADTPTSQMGFKRTIVGKGEGLTLACVEVHADCREQLLPDPRSDPVRAVIVAVLDDDEDVPDGNFFARLFLFDGSTQNGRRHLALVDALPGCQVEVFSSEAELFDGVVEALRSLDPDILLGFEVQQGSLGYLADRAAAALQRPNFLREISRLPEESSFKELQNDQYGWQHASGLHVAGRIVLNVWRLMRGELKLNIYTLENCAAAVLRLRIPHIPHYQLAGWFRGGPAGGRWRCLSHYVLRARLSLLLLDRLDILGRTSEMARTFGIDFFSVLSRGSQYRVESMMLRLAHTQNYLALSPSAEQVARQPAMEALPLVMEPASGMYPDPVCVLDFQSLYPSMIIAYNLCYSTCIGRPAHCRASPTAPIQLGCGVYALPPGAVLGEKDRPPGADGLIVAPNGVGFVSPDVRPGVLPRLLREILDTRIMVKAAMKRTSPAARVLLRCLNARQFGLKLIANVTYGYTAAGFSGRMPMAELADAIVQSGRETLEAAIRMVESNPDWRAKVIYGDTDSLFVQLPGRTVQDAFRIGAEIAAAVTAANPPPVVLKLEKVYRPCVLLSKKRYVGAMYESPDQKIATFDAKGIETVRRDTCPAVAKILEATLRHLFASGDLSVIRTYLERQWTRLFAGRVSVSDLIFAKEVRLGSYRAQGAAIPPAALVAARAMASDPRAEPRYGERVPYVVVHGEPGARLADMVVPPRALVESGGRLRLHALYYITKQIIPAVERVLNLVGADVRAWFTELPRPRRDLPQKRPLKALPLPESTLTSRRPADRTRTTIDTFYLSRHCAVCDDLTHATRPLCDRCLLEPQLAAAVLSARWNRLERQYGRLVTVCCGCGAGGGANAGEGGIVCDSLDCGIYFERRKVWYELRTAVALSDAGLKALKDKL